MEYGKLRDYCSSSEFEVGGDVLVWGFDFLGVDFV
jgi:hypothetical protein